MDGPILADDDIPRIPRLSAAFEAFSLFVEEDEVSLSGEEANPYLAVRQKFLDAGGEVLRIELKALERIASEFG